MKVISVNKKINLNYDIIDKYEAGISLDGNEVKSIYMSELSINDSYAVISKNEMYLINMFVKNTFTPEKQYRRRKLLLHKNEIKKIDYAIKKNKYVIIPLKIYLIKNNIKIELVICRHLRNIDKRKKIIKKETNKYLKKIYM